MAKVTISIPEDCTSLELRRIPDLFAKHLVPIPKRDELLRCILKKPMQPGLPPVSLTQDEAQVLERAWAALPTYDGAITKRNWRQYSDAFHKNAGHVDWLPDPLWIYPNETIELMCRQGEVRQRHLVALREAVDSGSLVCRDLAGMRASWDETNTVTVDDFCAYAAGFDISVVVGEKSDVLVSESILNRGEFGSAAARLVDVHALAAKENIGLVSLLPPVKDFDVVHIETLIVRIATNGPTLGDDAAVDVARRLDNSVIDSELLDAQPSYAHWILASERLVHTRNWFREVINSGRLAAFDYVTRRPIVGKLQKPDDQNDEELPTEVETDAEELTVDGLPTSELIAIFSTFVGDSGPKKLSDLLRKNRPDWVLQFRLEHGKAGNRHREATWNPFGFAVALVEGRAGRFEAVPIRSMNTVFERRSELQSWLENWRQYYERRMELLED